MLGKPHPEQDRVEDVGPQGSARAARPIPRVGRSIPRATGGPDEWLLRPPVEWATQNPAYRPPPADRTPPRFPRPAPLTLRKPLGLMGLHEIFLAAPKRLDSAGAPAVQGAPVG